MDEVTLKFEGEGAAETAQKFYTWLVDGGLEDQVVDTLSDGDVEVALTDIDNETFIVRFSCTLR